MQNEIKNIRKQLTENFGDEELNIFCQENFYEVYNNFTSGQTKNQRITALIDFAVRKGQIEFLLNQLTQNNKNLPHTAGTVGTKTNNKQEMVDLTNMTKQGLKEYYLGKYKPLVKDFKLDINSTNEEWKKEKVAVENELANCNSKKNIVYYYTCPLGWSTPPTYEDYTKIKTEYDKNGANDFNEPKLIPDNYSSHKFTDIFYDLKNDLKIQEIEILHICMHGKKENDNYFLIFKDNDNKEIDISIEEFKEFIRKITEDYKVKINCLLLSACHSFKFAEAASHYVAYAIGMNNKVQVTEATKFTEGFYQKIFRKSDICDAFCNGAIPSLGNIPDGTIFPKDIPMLYKNGKLLKNNKLCQ